MATEEEDDQGTPGKRNEDSGLSFSWRKMEIAVQRGSRQSWMIMSSW